MHLAALVEHAHADHATVLGQQLRGELELAEGDGLHRGGFQVEGAADFASGGVAMGMQHAIAAVGALAGEGDLGSGAIELGAPIDELFDAGRAFLHQHASCGFIAEAVPGLQSIFKMEADFVIIAECGSDAALGVLRVRFRDLALGQAKDAAGRGQVQSRLADPRCLRLPR